MLFLQVRTPEGLTAEHLDIIKLTAQCVARNGQSFLTGELPTVLNETGSAFLRSTMQLQQCLLS